jgi:Thermolysin metallopeptidase, alpha-helical domain/Thermolysin metallopeptidase, catalytic domain
MQGGIVPPHVLRALERHGEPEVRDGARRALIEMRALRARPDPRRNGVSHRVSAAPMHPQARRVFTCAGTEAVPGELLRREGQPACNDAEADRAFDAAGVVHAFWREVFGRDSLDGHGLHLLGSVHYGRRFDNAFWNGGQMVYGDGDGIVVAGYTSSIDVVAHEMTHAVVQNECALIYEGESGALSESVADVFGSLVKQRDAHQTADAADWLIGAHVFTEGVAARGLRSLAEPGSAYDDAALGGRDPQVAHMRDFVETDRDDGGVHVNSGIPNHAFYRFARALGGHAWDVAGGVWYNALRSGLDRRCGLRAFAEMTVAAAHAHGPDTVDALRAAWHDVGVPAGRVRSHGHAAKSLDERMEYVGVRGHVITAAIAVLGDGLPRTAEEICSAALARKLVPAGTSKKYVYTALIEYIARTKGHERKPAIVQDPDRRFRANHRADPWPVPSDVPAVAVPAAASLAALERVRAASVGEDPAAFEEAVCELFGTVGFVATHAGGYDAPDGYLDAPLGPLAYRVMLECKTGSANAIVTQPNVAEAAKYRATYGAAYCALVGPAFGAQTAFASELRAHGVSAWTVDDLAAVVQAGFDPASLRALFAPGLVADVLDDVVWTAEHGEAKRVGAICDALEDIAARQQRVALGAAPADAPLLDVDAAMMLLDEHFADAGSAARCTRGDVVAAFDWLTHPRVRRAIWTGEDRRAIVVTAALRTSASA